MKLKYYLRGAGIALIIISIIWMISSAFSTTSMSKAQIESEAKKLGMVYPEEKGTIADKMESEDDKNSEDDAAAQANATDNATGTDANATDVNATDANANGTDTNVDGALAETVEFTISRGETSSIISNHLQEQGIVDNAEAFDKFLTLSNDDNFLQPGTYTITKGSTFDEIANALMGK
ncbi:MAG: endolytic transglycosylase MltG [Lachnospiraceae bacterium]|nr:endolytic transglycosylase MltG [Lachnospiraceae bacterium]